MRGKLAAKMRTTINDPRLLDLTRSQAEMTMSFFREEESSHFSRIEEMLGILWTREDATRMFGKPSEGVEDTYTPAERIRYPLALIINPEIMKDLKSKFDLDLDETEDADGKPRMSHIPKNAQTMSHLSKEEFMDKVGFGSKAGDVYGTPNNRLNEGLRPTTPKRLGG